MLQNRHKLGLLYLSLCAAQLVIMGFGLVVAYQIQRSYSRNIDYERSINAEHRAIDELEVFARVASSGTVAPTDDSIRSQISQTQYAAKAFLRRTHEILDDSERQPNSPVGRSHADLQALVSQMNMVTQQMDLAEQSSAQGDRLLAQAHFTYADRAAARVQSILGHINQDMAHTKDELLLKHSAEASRAYFLLRPISALGILLVLPTLLYARRLSRNIMAYETQLESDRSLLEDRVARRTSELRIEIDRRERLETFNEGRNRLLERVAEGNDLEGILAQLADATEKSVPGSQCAILLDHSQEGSAAIAPNISIELAAYLQTVLLRTWDSASVGSARGRDTLWIRDFDPKTRVTFAEVWAQGFRGILAAPVSEPKSPLLGVIALVLRDPREPDPFTQEVLLSASRMAAVALGHERMQDELFRRAHYDALTGLPNRVLFEDRLTQAVALAGRRNSSLGVLCIDLDGFKLVNDHYGHDAGDWLLQQVAQRLSSQLRKSDTIARVGGDEFIAVIHNNREGGGVKKATETFLKLLAEPYVYGSNTLRTSASIGIALFPTDGTSGAELQLHADLAMYRAKECGRNIFQMYSTDLGDKLTRRKRIEEYIQESLASDGFELLYQPMYTVDRKFVGLEALVRFRDAELKEISPSEFIKVAEQTGHIVSTGEWVIREACRQAKEWQLAGLPIVPIAVNISAVQLVRTDFASRLADILGEIDLAPNWLHIEITETAIMSDFEEGGRQLRALAASGIDISIDDFGTGHSSLSYIHQLPIKTLKIDRSFVKRITDSHESKAIVRAIVAMAKSLELKVVAEGLETQEQLDAVATAGCDIVQGYLFARPLHPSVVLDLLKREPHCTLVSS